MGDIKRYQLFTHDDGDGFPYTEEETIKNGEWVKYSDHLQVVKELEEKIESQNKLMESMLERNCVNCNLFGEGCFLACGEAGLCFCNDWQPKEQD